MALTLSHKFPGKAADVIGGWTYLQVATVTFDSSYDVGGESLTAGDLNLPGTIVQLVAHPAAGYQFEYDYTNSKLKAFTPVRPYTATFDPASLASVTSRDDAITFTGVGSTDLALTVNPPNAAAASVVVQNARVTGTSAVTARLTNASAGAVDVASGTWTAFVVGANGAGKEIAASVDLSSVTTRVIAYSILGI